MRKIVHPGRGVKDPRSLNFATTPKIKTFYEQRIYTCVPGKLPALLSRFENHTLKIWESHGIKQAGFWTVLVGDGSHDLHYMLAWDSLADREKKWNAFQADPVWHKARDESEKTDR
jgi:NIPSNAP protein